MKTNVICWFATSLADDQSYLKSPDEEHVADVSSGKRAKASGQVRRMTLQSEPVQMFVSSPSTLVQGLE